MSVDGVLLAMSASANRLMHNAMINVVYDSMRRIVGYILDYRYIFQIEFCKIG